MHVIGFPLTIRKARDSCLLTGRATKKKKILFDQHKVTNTTQGKNATKPEKFSLTNPSHDYAVRKTVLGAQ